MMRGEAEELGVSPREPGVGNPEGRGGLLTDI